VSFHCQKQVACCERARPISALPPFQRFRLQRFAPGQSPVSERNHGRLPGIDGAIGRIPSPSCAAGQSKGAARHLLAAPSFSPGTFTSGSGWVAVPQESNVMARKRKAQTDDIAAVEELMHDLETRLRRLNAKGKPEVSGGADDIADFVSQMLARVAAQVRNTADAATDTLETEATEASTDIVKRIWEEMERRPMMTLALAAAGGYLLGLISKQDDAE
jgi:ElaB/YqjD/DUF883 family membrane-anchored ribosome-binding protein